MIIVCFRESHWETQAPTSLPRGELISITKDLIKLNDLVTDTRLKRLVRIHRIIYEFSH